jgi:hypothetical protein
MLTRVCLSLALLAATPAWPQEGATPTEDAPSQVDQSEMLTPPSVGTGAYPGEAGSRTRSNYLRTGWTASTSYSDNVLGSGSANPIADTIYSFWPTIEIDQTTSRQHLLLNYSPGFTVYQHTSSLNQTDQNAAFNFKYRLSPHITAIFKDAFQKSSAILDQPDSLSGRQIAGSSPYPPIAAVATDADQLTNLANVQLTYQFSMNGMIGASGTFTNLHYPDLAAVPGLYDSHSKGGSAFYNHRLSKMHYIGATYQYAQILSYPVNAQSTVQTHAVSFFDTIYLKPALTISVSGGPQHFEIMQSPLPAYGSWSPTLTASIGWQGQRMDAGLGYTRTVTAGGGLAGALQSNGASIYTRWKATRAWSAGLAANYAINRNVTPSYFVSNQEGGHNIGGTASVQHPIGEHYVFGLGYTFLRQSYSGIQVISNAPDTNREFISISYQFSRPLGR